MEEEEWLIALGSGGGGQQRKTLPGEGCVCDFCAQKRQHKAVVKSPPDLCQRACALMTAWESQVQPGRELRESHNGPLQ